jgi:hypothetical protein
MLLHMRMSTQAKVNGLRGDLETELGLDVPGERALR